MTTLRTAAPQVVLEIHSASPSAVSLAAAFGLARALGSGVRSVFIEDAELISLACLPCAREVSFSGRRSGPVTLAGIEQHMRQASSAVRRHIEELARLAEIPLQFGVVRDERERAIASIGAAGTLIALTEPLRGGDAVRLARLLAEGSADGVLIVGPRARRTEGAIVAACSTVQDIEDLTASARSYMTPSLQSIAVLLVAEDRLRALELEAAAHRLAEHMGRIEIGVLNLATHGPEALGLLLSRLEAGLLVAGAHGLFSPASGALTRLTAMLECPLLLLRRRVG